MEKSYPKVGDRGYLRQFTGDGWVDMCKYPVEVVSVSTGKVAVRHAKLVFPVFRYDPATMSDYYRQFDGKRVRFYDTKAEGIEPDPDGRVQELTWHPKRGLWGTEGKDADYPEYLVLGKFEFQPYLN